MYFSGFLVDTTTVLVVVETTIRWASTSHLGNLASHLGNLHQWNNWSSLTKRDSLGIFCISLVLGWFGCLKMLELIRVLITRDLTRLVWNTVNFTAALHSWYLMGHKISKLGLKQLILNGLTKLLTETTLCQFINADRICFFRKKT